MHLIGLLLTYVLFSRSIALIPIAALAALLYITLCSPAYAAEEPKGNIIMAKAPPHVLLIWNAEPRITDLAAERILGNRGLQMIESDAVNILAARAPSLEAKSIALQVVYERFGAENPAYGGPTLSRVEHLMTLLAAPGDITRNATQWSKDIAAGTAPKGLSITITGKLPSR